MKPIDMSKFKKAFSSKTENIFNGFFNNEDWLSLGNYALNWCVTGDFNRGFQFGKLAMVAGEPHSGKSYIGAILLKQAQEKGWPCFILDSENAMNEKWLNDLGVATTEDKLLISKIASIDNAVEQMGKVIKIATELKEAGESCPILVIIDSVKNLRSKTQMEQFDKGELKGDKGIQASQLGAFSSDIINTIGSLNIGVYCTNHTYISQDMFHPDQVIPGGVTFQFNCNTIITLQKEKLRGDKGSEDEKNVIGIRSTAQVRKTRENPEGLYEKITIPINKSVGLDPYGGLVDLFQKFNLLVKDGNNRKYVDLTGKVYKMTEKKFAKNHELLDLMMKEFNEKRKQITPAVEYDPETGEIIE